MRLTGKLCLFALLFMAISISQVQALQSSLATLPGPRLVNYPWMSLSRWYQMHSEDVALATAGEAPLLFIGDSITEAWEQAGQAYWEQYFIPLGAVNFGIGGDMIQNLLWRLQHGAIGALDPSAVVLLIGVNNLGFSQESPEAIAQGVIAVVDAMEEQFPNASILLMAVFPAGESESDSLRGKIKQINQSITSLNEREKVTYIDMGKDFIETDGSISSRVMPDYLHLSEEGYRRWTEAILPWIRLQFDLPEKAKTH
jgi:lysophospholipase L1-like esterase